MGRGSGFVLLIALVTACSSANSLQNACIPELTCKTHLELIEEPTNCSSCADCATDWGSCNPGGFACKQGQLDLRADTDSCETALKDVSAQYIAHSTEDAAGILSINKDRMGETIAGTVAFDIVSPGCVPTFDTPCAYTFQGLQLSFADFTIEPTDSLTWSDGTLTLTGPVAASDGGGGIAAPPTTAVLAFNVSDGSKQRVAVAFGTVSFSVFLDSTSLMPESLLVEGAGFSFGGYAIDDIFLDAPLAPQ